MPATYDASARARRLAEPPKRGQFGTVERDQFARDRARVLHSSAFRRLADKTQVVDPGADDFPRTRLTHSLEVAQIAREMGDALGCSADIVDAAGLAHDLGHPPFGHNGEAALDELSVGIGGFEGNAQTFRILTRLEPKAAGPGGAPAGLNLTRAVLDASTKYPWTRREGSGKFGVYADDLPAFEWMRADAPAEQRCLEASVMDWADDVAYSVHDLEDAIYAGQVRLDAVTDDDIDALIGVAARFGPWSADELAAGMERLLALPALVDVRSFDGSQSALRAVKRATSELTGRFVGAAVAATRAQAGSAALSRYDAEVTVPADVAIECALLKAIATHYVMHSAAAEQRRLDQRRLLRDVVSGLVAAGRDAIDVALRPAWDTAADDGQRLRVVIDQVAQLTDSSARSWQHRLSN